MVPLSDLAREDLGHKGRGEDELFPCGHVGNVVDGHNCTSDGGVHLQIGPGDIVTAAKEGVLFRG